MIGKQLSSSSKNSSQKEFSVSHLFRHRDNALSDVLMPLDLPIGGAVPSPFDCFLCNRGLKTLHVRMREHQRNALVAAQFLETHGQVDRVLYPGLPSHPQHELAKKQCYGFSGMLSFRIKGDAGTTKRFLNALKLFTLAESLGGYESLIEVPSLMTHQSVPPEQRAELGITDTLMRLSIGLEETGDIIQDLDQALKSSSSE